MSVALDRVETTLARLWNEQQAAAARAHACTVNLVVVCTRADQTEFAHGAVAAVLPVHPGRAIVAAVAPGGGTEITAEVALLRSGAEREACGEVVTLAVHDEGRRWLPTAVERLLAPAARVYLWWLGDLPDDDRVYHRLLQAADVVVVDSEAMDLGDLVILARRSVEARGRHALADLNWTRLRPWQELFACFFDDPAVLPQLGRARTLTVTHATVREGREGEPASTQAALFAGWFAGRTGALAARARWAEADGDGRVATVARARGGALTVRFQARERDDVYPGSLLGVELSTDDGSRFELCRAEDPLVLSWTGECEGAVIPHAVARIDVPGPVAMLARELERPAQDALFEASLATTAALLAPLYARAAAGRERP